MQRNLREKPEEGEFTKAPATLSRSEQHVNRVLSRIEEKRQRGDDQSVRRYIEPEDEENKR
ncbi:MAG: hypothetical protein ABSD96_06665 [Candidatus Korobacteraceae bacterium]|jgi:hypothetical protein